MEQNVHKVTECEPSREVPGTEVTEPLLFQIPSLQLIQFCHNVFVFDRINLRFREFNDEV